MDRVTIGSATVDNQIIGSEGYITGFTLVEPIDGLRESLTGIDDYSAATLM